MKTVWENQTFVNFGNHVHFYTSTETSQFTPYLFNTLFLSKINNKFILFTVTQ